MGLRRNFINGRPVIEHSSSQPRVYLDTWAFDALERNYRNRFIAALNTKQGTLCLSFFNAIELINYKNIEMRNKLLSLIDAVDSVFIDIDPLNVVKTKTFYDRDLATECEPKIYPLEIFRATSVIKQMEEDMGRFSQSRVYDFEPELLPQLLEFRKNNKKMKTCKRRRESKRYAIKNSDPAVKVRAVFEACFDFIALNRDMRMGNAEWRDTFHIMVPACCCDFLLIDSRWTQCLNDAGLAYPDVAKVFNSRGIEKFLSELEEFKSPVEQKKSSIS
jgi:hypothetical protein